MGRAVALVAALCLAALAAAVAASSAVERSHPGLLHPPPPPFAALDLPRIDVHQHFGPPLAEDAVRLARANGIGLVVNLSGGFAGGALEAQLAAARPLGGRVVTFAELDPEGCCGGAWSAREAARLARDQALGASGLSVEEAALAPFPVDAPSLGPIWQACAALGLPVFLHQAGGGAPGALERLVRGNPRVSFVATHFGEQVGDPGALARLLDRLPNLSVDTAASAPDLGRVAGAARRAILAHPDRVLFGTEIQYVQGTDGSKGVVFGAGWPGPDPTAEMRRFFEGTFRFLETRDRDIPSPTPAQGDWDLEGLGLPREVLQQVYHRNAERLLRLPALRAEGSG